MCVGDYKIGRLVRWTKRTVLVDSNGVLIASRNHDRVGIGFFCASLLLQISFDSMAAAASSPAASAEADAGTIFTLVQHGDLPTRNWYGIIIDDPTYVEVWEAWLPESALVAEPPFPGAMKQ